MKVIPQSAALYRAAVRDLNSTLHDPTERAEARAFIAELLGRQVRIRQDGAAAFARLEIGEAVLLASAARPVRTSPGPWGLRRGLPEVLAKVRLVGEAAPQRNVTQARIGRKHVLSGQFHATSHDEGVR
jgi:hypothetical protein